MSLSDLAKTSTAVLQTFDTLTNTILWVRTQILFVAANRAKNGLDDFVFSQKAPFCFVVAIFLSERPGL